MEHQGPTDHVPETLTVTLTFDLQCPAIHCHEPFTRKRSRSLGSQVKSGNRRMDEGIALPPMLMLSET